MIQEYGHDLLVVSALDPDNTRYKVEVFRGMEEFQYLSIPPRQPGGTPSSLPGSDQRGGSGRGRLRLLRLYPELGR